MWQSTIARFSCTIRDDAVRQERVPTDSSDSLSSGQFDKSGYQEIRVIRIRLRSFTFVQNRDNRAGRQPKCTKLFFMRNWTWHCLCNKKSRKNQTPQTGASAQESLQRRSCKAVCVCVVLKRSSPNRDPLTASTKSLK